MKVKRRTASGTRAARLKDLPPSEKAGSRVTGGKLKDEVVVNNLGPTNRQKKHVAK